MPITIGHIITDLAVGGAQVTLYKLLSLMDLERFRCFVISLTGFGPIGEKMRARGVPVYALGMKSSLLNPLRVLSLIHRLRRLKPDLIQTWLYHADLVGGLSAMFVGRPKLVWGVHHTSLNPSWNSRRTILLAKVNGIVSGVMPDKIVYCSEDALAVHRAIGFSPDRSRVIRNGVDTIEFHPDDPARRSVRSELGLPDNTIIIGLLGRFHPIKNHQKFFEAARLLHRVRPDVNFVLCGDGINCENTELMAYVRCAGVTSVTHLLDRRSDIARITAALDIATCFSYDESFSLVLGEAMACGVLCVTTEIPGPASLVGDAGWIVPVGDYKALASTWSDILSLTWEERKIRGLKARERIIDQFSLASMVREYEELYEDLLRRYENKRNYV